MAKNTIEMLEAQAKAGRGILGAQVTIGIPGSPVAELIDVAGGVYTFRELMPEDSDKKPREWEITEEDAAIVHYLSNRKNEHVVPEAEVDSGILVVNGKNVVMGDYNADGRVVIPVPGGVIFSAYRTSDKENSFVVSYDAEKDTMLTCMVLEANGELVTLSSEFEANGETTRLNLVANNRYETVTDEDGKPKTHFLGADLFKVYGLGRTDGYAIISVPVAELVAVEGNADHIVINSDKEVDDDGIVTGDNKTRAFMLANGELEELPDIAISASYGAGKTTVICKNSVAILNDYSGLECLVNDATVVYAITKHPYYTGKRTVYAEDGSKSTEYIYNNGEEVIRFRRSVSDRGIDVKRV